MNYPLICGIILLLAALLFGQYERSQALSWENKYNSLVSSYNATAQKAKDDAAKQEQADLANLKAQSSEAIQQATSAKKQAQLAAATYTRKLAQLAGKSLTLGEQCANTPIPASLLP